MTAATGNAGGRASVAAGESRADVRRAIDQLELQAARLAQWRQDFPGCDRSGRVMGCVVMLRRHVECLRFRLGEAPLVSVGPFPIGDPRQVEISAPSPTIPAAQDRLLDAASGAVCPACLGSGQRLEVIDDMQLCGNALVCPHCRGAGRLEELPQLESAVLQARSGKSGDRPSAGASVATASIESDAPGVVAQTSRPGFFSAQWFKRLGRLLDVAG